IASRASTSSAMASTRLRPSGSGAAGGGAAGGSHRSSAGSRRSSNRRAKTEPSASASRADRWLPSTSANVRGSTRGSTRRGAPGFLMLRRWSSPRSYHPPLPGTNANGCGWNASVCWLPAPSASLTRTGSVSGRHQAIETSGQGPSARYGWAPARSPGLSRTGSASGRGHAIEMIGARSDPETGFPTDRSPALSADRFRKPRPPVERNERLRVESEERLFPRRQGRLDAHRLRPRLVPAAFRDGFRERRRFDEGDKRRGERDRQEARTDGIGPALMP